MIVKTLFSHTKNTVCVLHTNMFKMYDILN